ncbi:hypothetical protein LCGC14_2512830 [marine sediment metagenome]|uniref:Uncharacterized protein n=1 Tax=marine sediment metagenome TaxID=412755 RepID=A0A0F9BLL1_9ZZZZ
MPEGKTVSTALGFTYLKKFDDMSKRFDISNSTLVRMAIIHILDLTDKEQDEVIGKTIKAAKLNEMQTKKLRLQEQIKELDQDTYDIESK